MILDIDQMDYDERRSHLVLVKEMLRQMCQFPSISLKQEAVYEAAYLALSAAIRVLDQQYNVDEPEF